MRFTVILYGDVVFEAGTFDEVNSRIADHHRRRQKAAGFGIRFRADHVYPGEMRPHYGGYAIVDNHD